MSEVSEAIQAQDEDLQIYTSGATNIFKYPELSDTEKASGLLNTLEQKELLKGLFEEQSQNEDPGADPGTGIQVYIGDRASGSDDEGLQRCNSELYAGRRASRHDWDRGPEADGL